MALRKGDVFRFEDKLHIVDAVADDVVYVECIDTGTIRKFGLAEATQLFEDSVKKGWYRGSWPIKAETEMILPNYPIEQLLRSLGVGDNERQMFKAGRAIAISVELEHDGGIYLTAIRGLDIGKRIRLY